MIARFTPCDRDLLRQVLRDDLSTVHQEQLESHLTTCEICRSELERMAGGEGWLSEVREHLSSAEVTPYVTEAKQRGCSKATELLDHADFDSDDDHDPLSFLEPSADPDKLGRLGVYEVESVIGRGGMGIVLKAFDAALNRHVAIKVLAAELATSGAARRRFARESQAAAAIAHEHVVAIHAVDNSGKLPFLVMPYIPGKSLQERLDESGPLEVKEVLRIGLQAASGLAAAHAQGLVHRDIKPANLLLENGIERVRITDFGLARAVDDASQTQSGFIAGTPQYMAPEQARGEPVDHRADLFSLGSVMYAMCTGRPPFRAETTFAVLRRICEESPRPLREINPDIPDWLQAVIAKLHARDPAGRFQSAAEVAALLEQYLAHLQHPAAHPLPKFHQPESQWKHLRRRLQNRVIAWVAGGVVVVALVLIYRNNVAGRSNQPVRGLVSPVHAVSASQPAASSFLGAPPGNEGVGSAISAPGGMPQSPSWGAVQADPWRQWDAALQSIDVDLQQIERQSLRRIAPGSPIDQREEINAVLRELEAVEAEFRPAGTTGKRSR